MSAKIPYHKRTTCRVCGNEKLLRFLKLGPTPLANSFLESPQEFANETSYPLELYFCKKCTLIQILDVIDPEVLFRNYIYVTGTSDTIAEHNLLYAQTVVNDYNLKSDDLVIEIASNDGSLLKCFQVHGMKPLGVEPAANIAQKAQLRGIDTINEFFNSKNAYKLRSKYGPAKAVIGNNVLAHVDETTDFLKGCKTLMGEDSVLVIEVPYLKDLIERLEYDTVYHEHLCYFSVNSLLYLYDDVGLSILRIDFIPIHGGSLRIYASLTSFIGKHAEEVLAIAENERKFGLSDLSTYKQFAKSVAKSKHELKTFLTLLKKNGNTIAGYGAPAKGNTLLNYCSIGTDLLPFTVDKNTMKVGLYTPGMHIPVLPVSAILAKRPDYLLILSWNFADEIIRQQNEYRQGGGRFIIPIPTPTVI